LPMSTVYILVGISIFVFLGVAISSIKLIQSAIENLASESTLLVIAHRLSTIANADYIYVMDKGNIAESGSYQELSEKTGGIFSRMLKIQRVDT